jgi:hypothetical protein
LRDFSENQIEIEELINKKFYKMWNHDRYFRNLVGQNVFEEE